MALKCQNWRLTFMKFQETLLAYKTPKCGIYIAQIGIKNAKKRHLKHQKSSFLSAFILAF